MMNLLLAGVCALIPFVGQIVLKGWLITGFWGRTEERPETFPDFDFSNFGEYLERGIWPFLVTLATSFGLAIVCVFFMLPMGMLTSLVSSGSRDSGCIALFLTLLMMVFYFIMMTAAFCVMTPLVLRACITQDFAQAFNFAFVKRFLELTWKELLISSAFYVVVAVVLAGLGFVALCIGMYFATVLIYFCWMHLQKQLYQLYLSRGGEPVPPSPKMHNVLPPAAPTI
jgi:hypothetical protein